MQQKRPKDTIFNDLKGFEKRTQTVLIGPFEFWAIELIGFKIKALPLAEVQVKNMKFRAFKLH